MPPAEAPGTATSGKAMLTTGPWRDSSRLALSPTYCGFDKQRCGFTDRTASGKRSRRPNLARELCPLRSFCGIGCGAAPKIVQERLGHSSFKL